MKTFPCVNRFLVQKPKNTGKSHQKFFLWVWVSPFESLLGQYNCFFPFTIIFVRDDKEKLGVFAPGTNIPNEFQLSLKVSFSIFLPKNVKKEQRKAISLCLKNHTKIQLFVHEYLTNLKSIWVWSPQALTLLNKKYFTCLIRL